MTCAPRSLRLPFARFALSGFLAVALAAGARAKELREIFDGLYGGDRTITLLVNGGPPHAGDFDASKGLKTFRGITRAIAGIPSNLPVDSSSASFTYDINPATGVPERVTTDGLGPMLVQRAQTLGQFRLNTAFVWTRLEHRTIDGREIDDLRSVAPLKDVPGGQFAFEQDYLDLRIRVRAIEDVFAYIFTFGVTDWMDINAVILTVNVDLKVEARAMLHDGGRGVHGFDPTPGRVVAPNTSPTDPAVDGAEDSAFGMGDTLLRLKVKPLDAIFRTSHPPLSDYFQFALLAQMRLPTGDVDNLLGSEYENYRLLAIFSQTFGGFFEPHVNLGYKFSVQAGGHDVFLYSAGFAIRCVSWLTVFADVNGRKEEVVAKSATDIVDLLVGFKVNPFEDFVLGVNFLVPLNEQGLRTDFAPSVGLEYTF